MRIAKVRSVHSRPQPHAACNRREQSRVPMDFELMYSVQDDEGEVLIGDGNVTDLSRRGLGIRGNAAVKAGMELTLFLYLPDGQDPLFIMEARVVWSTGHRFGVKIVRMNLREQNRLRYFLSTNLLRSH